MTRGKQSGATNLQAPIELDAWGTVSEVIGSGIELDPSGCSHISTMKKCRFVAITYYRRLCCTGSLRIPSSESHVFRQNITSTGSRLFHAGGLLVGLPLI